MKKRTQIIVGLLFWCIAFGVSVALAIDNSDCLDCHGDSSLSRQQSQGGSDSLFVDTQTFQSSVHNVNGIGCVECHADVTALDMDQEVPHPVDLAPVNCASCHGEVAVAYRLGVHQRASAKGITIQCHACHGYHDVVSSENKPVLERENRSCLKCHEPNKYHAWLPQKASHFAFVQCTVCHAPETPHHIHLRLYDLAKKESLAAEEVFAALGTDSAGLLAMFNKDGKVDELNGEEFEEMVFALNRRGVHATFHAELLSAREPRIHEVTKVSAKRLCEDCHAPGSKFFDSVSIVFVSKDGSTRQVAVDRKVLESYRVSNFYVPGGSRVRLTDRLGVLAVLGAAAGVALHLGVRVATIPRRRKRMGKKNGETV